MVFLVLLKIFTRALQTALYSKLTLKLKILKSSLLFQIPEPLIIIALFLLIILAEWLGFRVKQAQIKQKAAANPTLGSVEGSLLGLLALLLSFTFSMSASKNDTRRQVIVEEANDIGTVILRCDLYQDSEKQFLKAELYKYLEARIAYYIAGTDLKKIDLALVKSDQQSRILWNKVTQLAKDEKHTVATQQMVPALNTMFDIVTTRDAGNNAHIPDSILWLLFLLTGLGGFLIGYSSNGDRINWIVVSGFALVMVMTIYLIIDLDRPQQGIINMDQTHQRIVDLKALFNN